MKYIINIIFIKNIALLLSPDHHLIEFPATILPG